MTERLDYTRIAGPGMKAFAGVQAYVAQSGLPKMLIDLVYLRVSLMNGCVSGVHTHSRHLLIDGMAIEKLALVPVWRDAGKLFSDDERAALAWAETVTRAGETRVPDEEFEAAVLQFSDKALIDLTIAIGFMNAYNRLSISFRTPLLAGTPRSGAVSMRPRRAPKASPGSLSDDG